MSSGSSLKRKTCIRALCYVVAGLTSLIVRRAGGDSPRSSVASRLGDDDDLSSPRCLRGHVLVAIFYAKKTATAAARAMTPTCCKDAAPDTEYGWHADCLVEPQQPMTSAPRS